jgi:plasmid stabilization system protein ParE
MTLRVVVHRGAQDDLDKYVAWLSRHAPVTTAAWFARLEAQILGLGDKAARCLPAAEARRTSVDLRESRFGKRPNVFRIIFYLERDAVHVIRVRRGQRRPLTRKEIQEGIDRGGEENTEQSGA